MLDFILKRTETMRKCIGEYFRVSFGVVAGLFVCLFRLLFGAVSRARKTPPESKGQTPGEVNLGPEVRLEEDVGPDTKDIESPGRDPGTVGGLLGGGQSVRDRIASMNNQAEAQAEAVNTAATTPGVKPKNDIERPGKAPTVSTVDKMKKTLETDIKAFEEVRESLGRASTVSTVNKIKKTPETKSKAFEGPATNDFESPKRDPSVSSIDQLKKTLTSNDKAIEGPATNDSESPRRDPSVSSIDQIKKTLRANGKAFEGVASRVCLI